MSYFFYIFQKKKFKWETFCWQWVPPKKKSKRQTQGKQEVAHNWAKEGINFGIWKRSQNCGFSSQAWHSIIINSYNFEKERGDLGSFSCSWCEDLGFSISKNFCELRNGEASDDLDKWASNGWWHYDSRDDQKQSQNDLWKFEEKLWQDTVQQRQR